jgi:drug/metabolite transporter (DMT)-like permease
MVLMWIIVLLRKSRVQYGSDMHRLFAIFGMLQFSLNYLVVYNATAYLVSGLVSVIFSLMVLFNTLFAWWFFREKPTTALVSGAIFGICGLTALFYDDITGLSLNDTVVLGIALSLLSTLMASSGNTMATLLKMRGIDVITCNCWGMTYGTLYLFVAILLTGQPWQFSLQTDYVLSLLYLSIAGTVIAFWAYLTIIHRIGAPRAAYISVLFPLVAILVSTFYEDMHWTLSKLLGVAFIIVGNLFIIQRKQIRTPSVQ